MMSTYNCIFNDLALTRHGLKSHVSTHVHFETSMLGASSLESNEVNSISSDHSVNKVTTKQLQLTSPG